MKIIYGSLVLGTLVGLLCGCSGRGSDSPVGNEREFARQLGVRMCTILSEDSNNVKAGTPFDETRYTDPQGELAIALAPMNLGEVAAGASIKDGLTEYLNLTARLTATTTTLRWAT